MWGIGAVLYVAATSREPFRSLTGSSYDQLERVADPVGADRRVPPAFAQLVKNCLDADPAVRPSAPGLAEALGALV